MFRNLLFCLPIAIAFQVSAAAQSVDEIVAKNIQAIGGLEKLKSAQTIRMTGKMALSQGMEAPIVIEFKRPNQMRLEFSLQGLTGVQAYNGKTGWQIMPFGGKKDPEPMGEDDVKEAAEQADFEGPLVDYKAKGNKVELVGKEKVEGTDTYKLKVTLKNGDVQYIYLDADSYLEIRNESKRTIRGSEREIEGSIGDYKNEGGLILPHSFEQGAKGSQEKQKVTIEKVEINPPIDDSRFKMPEVKTAPNAGEKQPEDKPKESQSPEKKPPTTKP
jgi:outer membrane lipoprotein-sorting protein